MLDDEEAEVRAQAARALGAIARDVEAGRPALREALNDKDAAVRLEAAIGLAKLGGEAATAALSTLQAAARDKSHPDRLRAIEALGEIGPSAAPAVPLLVLALREEGPVRLRAVEALGRIGPPAREAAPALERVLSDPDLQARAAIALWEVGREAETTVPLLVEALRSPALRPPTLRPGYAGEPPPSVTSTNVRRFNVFSQGVPGGTSSPQAVPPSFRREVIEALGRMKGQARAAVPALREAAKEADPALRNAAAKALEAIDPAGTTGPEAQ
jgi:HEAT repeat protein